MTKNPTTLKEQLEILKTRNIVIDDEAFCINTLKTLNYYRLTAYLLPFKLSANRYLPVSFGRIYNIYEFDRKLRSCLLAALEEVELAFKAKIAYYHAHKYGALGYMDKTTFNTKHDPITFSNKVQTLIAQNKDIPFVKHHMNNRNGEFPIWVLVEVMSFGMISKFYADLKPVDAKALAKPFAGASFLHIGSWLYCLSILRNRCAHYARLYNYKFSKTPRPDIDSLIQSNTLFDYISALKLCYHDSEKWNNGFLLNLNALIDEYHQDVDLLHIGFPDNWNKVLQKSTLL